MDAGILLPHQQEPSLSRFYRRLLLACLAFLSLTASSLGSAAQSYGPFAVVGSSGQERNPAVASGSNPDAYFVVYEYDVVNDSKPQIILGILHEQPGKQSPYAAGIAFGTAQDRQSSPDVAYNDKNNVYLVVWQEEPTTGGDSNILGQVIDGKGQPKSAVIKVATDSEPEALPRIAYNPDDNEFLVVFQKGSGIYGNSYHPKGTEKGASGIWARRLKGDGTTEWPPFKIADFDSEKAAGVANPDVSYGLGSSGKGQYLVAWERWQEGVILSSLESPWIYTRRDVRATHISLIAGKEEIGPAFCISCEQGTPRRKIDEIEPDIAYNPNERRWLVVYSIDSTNFPNENIFAVEVDSSDIVGEPIGPINVNQYYVETRRRPRVAYSEASTQYVVVWAEQDVQWRYPQYLFSARIDNTAERVSYPEDRAIGREFWLEWHYSAAAVAVKPTEEFVVWEEPDKPEPPEKWEKVYKKPYEVGDTRLLGMTWLYQAP